MRHPRLNSDAKILLLYLQGLPAERRGSALNEHARALGITGRAYQRAKELLVVNGFLHERQGQNSLGHWMTEQLLANVPLSREEAVLSLDTAAGAVAGPPSARKPTVGQPGGRVVGGCKPVGEEREKNSSHPPSEAPPSEDPLSEAPPEDGEAWGAEEIEAERALLSLRRCHRSLHLGVVEARKLVRLAVEWLRRGVTAEEMRRVLAGDLPPGGVRSAVGFLRHRLVQKLPEAPGAGRGGGGGRVRPAPDRDGGVGARPAPEGGAGRTPAPLPPTCVSWVTCQGPGDEHVFRVTGDGGADGADGAEAETHCGPCRRQAAWDLWSERRAAQLAAEQAERAEQAGQAGQAGQAEQAGWRAEQPGRAGRARQQVERVERAARATRASQAVGHASGHEAGAEEEYRHTPWRERVAALEAGRT
ncbi:hypothetical protein OG909_14740 [Streptomyces sp. NBC_01754]|uniref:hypothetical protein n=1 Tax=Streptomyces sp. NBC_01754 TaxID=2975930 RepID=UPI002DD8BD13|nr:hypothetical protein [Streptomyces sp. NBC_01754]WSC93439.1 hypothetical protein OG909_14740 [Streptomyces sp. NBC_01754]